MYHALLFLHVLLAFTLVAAVTLFWALIFGTRPGRATLTPVAAMWLGRAGAIVVGIGAVGVLIFGIWLAIERSAYHPWDGWILASLILWVIAVGTGQRAGRSSSGRRWTRMTRLCSAGPACNCRRSRASR